MSNGVILCDIHSIYRDELLNKNDYIDEFGVLNHCRYFNYATIVHIGEDYQKDKSYYDSLGIEVKIGDVIAFSKISQDSVLETYMYTINRNNILAIDMTWLHPLLCRERGKFYLLKKKTDKKD